jgi:hypothetical protein
VNPYEGQVNQVNAAGTSEPLAAHVAAVILLAGAGVLILRVAHCKFVIAAGAGVG